MFIPTRKLHIILSLRPKKINDSHWKKMIKQDTLHELISINYLI